MEIIDKEIQFMIEEDNRVVECGKIDWEPLLISICHTIAKCTDTLKREAERQTKYSIPFESMEEIDRWDPQFIRETNRVLDNARKKLDEIIKLIRNTELCSRIESVASKIKEWEEKSPNSSDEEVYPKLTPWRDVALSMLKYPDRVVFDYDICPYCGHQRISVFFHSPDWTWAKMCGRSYDEAICLHCRKVEPYGWFKMN